jgi:hypothetical protein
MEKLPYAVFNNLRYKDQSYLNVSEVSLLIRFGFEVGCHRRMAMSIVDFIALSF